MEDEEKGEAGLNQSVDVAQSENRVDGMGESRRPPVQDDDGSSSLSSWVRRN